MRVEVDTKSSSAKFNRVMGQLPKQIRYASALALTRTAQDAQEEVRRQLPSRFIMRSQWVPKGIRIQRATKANLESTVRVLDDFMALQETGGIGETSVPIGARPKPISRTPPSKWPGALLKKPKHFIAPIKSGSDQMVLWRRRSKKKNSPLRLMYVFEDRVKIKPRFGFAETVEQVGLERFKIRFEEAVEQALASAQ
jgi:hypothetical protein